MNILPLQTTANQNFSAVLDNNQWLITLKTTNGVVSASLALNGVEVVNNSRVVANGFLIPSRYEEAGNFVLFSLNQQLPDYTQFGISQTLVFFTSAELTAARIPSGDTVTAADFDPFGALPLRFKPQGYTLA